MCPSGLKINMIAIKMRLQQKVEAALICPQLLHAKVINMDETTIGVKAKTIAKAMATTAYMKEQSVQIRKQQRANERKNKQLAAHRQVKREQSARIDCQHRELVALRSFLLEIIKNENPTYLDLKASLLLATDYKTIPLISPKAHDQKVPT